MKQQWIFCNNLFSCVIGKHHWKQQKKHKLICELATISDKKKLKKELREEELEEKG